jgi:NitT/TauT family transport system substrate-binding protein
MSIWSIPRLTLGLAVAGSLATALAAPLASAEDLPKLKVGITKMAALTTPWVAQQQGIYKKHGLDVELIELPPQQTISAFQAGELDIILSIPGTAMTAVERGFDMVAIGQNEISHATTPDTGSIQVRADSDIKSLADMKGKKVAVSGLRGQKTVEVYMLIEKAGVNLKDVTFIEMPFPNMVDALRHKQVDAVAVVDPYTTQLVSSGLGKVLSWDYVEAIPEQPLGAWWAKSTFIKKSPDLVKKFTEASKDSIDWINSDPARARQKVAEFTGLDPALVKDMPLILWDHKIKADRWQAVIDLMRERGQLNKPHKVEDFLAESLKASLVN